MDEKPLVVVTDTPPAAAAVPPKKSTAWTRAARYARSLLAASIWTYVFLKLFVLEVDEILIRELLPQAMWLVQYRGIVILGVLAVLAIIAWGFKLLGWVLYIMFYPFILPFWHVPAFLIRRRSWTLTVALIAATIAAARSLRWTLIVAGCFTTGTVLIAAGIHGAPVFVGMVLLGASLMTIYARIIMDAFRSSLDMFSSQSLDKMWSAVSNEFTPAEEIRNIDVDSMTETQKDTWVTNLQLSILYGRVCYFVADKLRNLRQGRITAAIAGVKIAWLFLTTVVVFAMLSLGLYKFDHSQYVTSGMVCGFDFLWYAFQASFLNGVQEVVPAGAVARTLFMLNELTTGLILFVIVVFFLTGVQAARKADQMDSLIQKIREHGDASERLVKEQFGLTIAAAIVELTRLRPGFMVSWIFQVSPELRPVHSDENKSGQQ